MYIIPEYIFIVSKDYDQIVLQNIIIHISNQKVKFPGILFADLYRIQRTVY